MSTIVLKALPGKLDNKKHSPRVFSISRQALCDDNNDENIGAGRGGGGVVGWD